MSMMHVGHGATAMHARTSQATSLGTPSSSLGHAVVLYRRGATKMPALIPFVVRSSAEKRSIIGFSPGLSAAVGPT